MPTVVPSDGNSINMLLYQMKLSTFKKKATASLMKIIKTMLMIDKRMAIKQFNSQNEAFKEKPICGFEDLPEMEDEMAAYFPLVHDKKNKDGMSIVFRLSTEHSLADWRRLLEKDSNVQHLKLYLGVHKLPSTETKIIGFINQKLPETTFINHYEDHLQSQLLADDPVIAVECIFPKTESGFNGVTKTDVLGIWACKSEAEAADKMMKKLLPPQAEGEYYVSFQGLDDYAKHKTYQHQNWYTHRVKRISISDFQNINRKYNVGLSNDWSFREFMKLQPMQKTTIPIDVDNGGLIKKGTKILVLKKYMPEAKKLYEEFRSLTQTKPGDDYDDDMWSNDDDTQVNSNIKGYMEQLNAMFESDEFPVLDSTEPETNGRAPGIAAADNSISKASSDTCDYSRRKQEKKNTRKSKGRQPQKGQSKTSKTTRAAQGGSVSLSNSQKSWSDVVSAKQRAVTTLDPQQHSRNVKNDQGDKDMDELKDMIQTLLMNSEIA
jgi:hypothetical protein